MTINGLGIGLGFGVFGRADTAPPSGGPLSDLFQRVGTGLVPINAAANPPSSFVDPIGEGWKPYDPNPLVVLPNVNADAGELEWEYYGGSSSSAIVKIGGFSSFEVTINARITAWLTDMYGLCAIGNMNIAAHNGYGIVYFESAGFISLSIAEFIDGVLVPLTISHYPFVSGDHVIKFAYKQATNQLAAKLDSNAVIVATPTIAPPKNELAIGGVRRDTAPPGSHNWYDIYCDITPTII